MPKFAARLIACLLIPSLISASDLQRYETQALSTPLLSIRSKVARSKFFSPVRDVLTYSALLLVAFPVGASSGRARQAQPSRQRSARTAGIEIHIIERGIAPATQKVLRTFIEREQNGLFRDIRRVEIWRTPHGDLGARFEKTFTAATVTVEIKSHTPPESYPHLVSETFAKASFHPTKRTLLLGAAGAFLFVVMPSAALALPEIFRLPATTRVMSKPHVIGPPGDPFEIPIRSQRLAEYLAAGGSLEIHTGEVRNTDTPTSFPRGFSISVRDDARPDQVYFNFWSISSPIQADRSYFYALPILLEKAKDDGYNMDRLSLLVNVFPPSVPPYPEISITIQWVQLDIQSAPAGFPSAPAPAAASPVYRRHIYSRLRRAS